MRRQPRQSIVQIGSSKRVINLIPLEDIKEDVKSANLFAAGKAKIDEAHGAQSVLPVFRVGTGVKDVLGSLSDKNADYDRYGFFVGNDPSSSQVFHKSKVVESKVRKQREEKEMLRSKKWTEILNEWDKGTSGRPPTDDKIKEKIRKGIPNDKRAAAWYHISGADRFAQQYPNPSILSAVTHVSERILDEIERDIDRTFPRHRLFVDKASARGSTSLRNVLRWYAEIDPEVGYCQGMGFLAGMFVIYMDEKNAFYTFCAAMQVIRDPNPLRSLYLPSMEETQRALYIFGELGKQYLGPLWAHMLEEGMHPSMYATEWLMTMFCRGFSFDLTTRVMDIYLKEGYKIVYRVALALIKNIEKELMDADFEDIMKTVRIIPELTDADTVLELAYKIPVRRSDIARYLTNYEKMKEPSGSNLGETSGKAVRMSEDIAPKKDVKKSRFWG